MDELEGLERLLADMAKCAERRGLRLLRTHGAATCHVGLYRGSVLIKVITFVKKDRTVEILIPRAGVSGGPKTVAKCAYEDFVGAFEKSFGGC